MRLRIILLAVATSSLVLVSFLVPLALVLRSLAADRAVSTATAEAQSLALLVPTLGQHSLQLELDTINAAYSTPVTIFLPDGTELGPAAVQSTAEMAAVRLARLGHSFSTDAPGGKQILIAVQGLTGGTAVIRTFVPDAVLRHGVARAWLVLGGVGLFLLLLSIAVADQLARSLVRPLKAVALVSDRLAAGDLSARATEAGPPEVRRAGAGLNRLADRIGDLLAHERETVADLSHRLRTPLTALRIDAESLRASADLRYALLDDVDAVERTVSEIIHEARRPKGDATAARCEAAQVVRERAAFWWPLAEDQARRMSVEVEPGPVFVRVSPDDLAACADILLENVFAHTPEAAGFSVRLSRRAGGGGWLVVADDGPGFPVNGADPTQRGLSRAGSTGLGLDIARRITQAANGTLTLGRSASGGGSVTLGLGPPARPADGPAAGRRHRRRYRRVRLQRVPITARSGYRRPNGKVRPV
jgi:signal transduction histidine kinase